MKSICRARIEKFEKQRLWKTVLLFFFLVSSSGAFSQKKPNIIFILADDMGYGDVGVFFQNARQRLNDPSKPFELTPHLDALATSGAQLTQQYCNAPVCAPSRASLLTGVHQGNAQVRDNQFDKALENNHTIATVLKKAGYATAAIGKWGLQGESTKVPYSPAHPLKRGFDHYFGYIRHVDGHEHYPYEGLYRGKKEVWENYKEVSSGLSKCYTTDLWTAVAKKWICEKVKENAAAPFFMYLAYDAPHAVLELPTGAYPAGGGLHGGLQWTGSPGRMINTASGTIDSFIYPEYQNATYDNDNDASTPQVAWPDTYKRYATANRRIDDAIGDLMQLLKDLKIDNNTLVVFTSDNGPSIESYLPNNYAPNLPTFFDSYGPFDGIKRDCWEGGVRMPTIAAWPAQIPAKKVCTTPSMLSDWMATFAQAAGVPVPARSDGVSLLPALTGKGVQTESTVYVEYNVGNKTPDFTQFEPSHRNRQRSQMQLLRIGNLVGVRYNIQSAEDDFEIYDVVKDPKQGKNLASAAGYQAMQKKMKAGVLQLRKADTAAPRPYDTALLPAVELKKKVQGFEWEFFEGAFPWVVSVSGRKPQSKGTAKSATGAEGPDKGGMLYYKGYIDVPADGKYSFLLQTSNKAFMRLHGAALIDADFGYTPGTVKTSAVYVEKGYHPISVWVIKKPGAKNELKLKWRKGASSAWQTIFI